MKIVMTFTSMCVGAVAALTAVLVSEKANEELPARLAVRSAV